MHTIKFGLWSTTLLIGSLHGLAMAALLLRSRSNRTANRFLAVLLLAVVLLITPYTIGYAGVYDAYPQLTYAPFFWTWSLGPLLYFHVRQLGEPPLPRGWGWHFLPGALQGAYYCIVVWLPLATKHAWGDAVHEPWIVPLQSLGFYVSMTGYWLLAFRHHLRYQHWLRDNSGQREELRLGGQRGVLLAIAAATLLALGYDLVDRLFVPLDYFDEFGLYLAFALLVYYLGIEGWRTADRAYPQMTAGDVAPVDHTPVDTAPAPLQPTPAARDWREPAERWAATVASAGWWREPDLSLADLARRLGTNTHSLSRALNEGLGQNFSEFVNRQRIDAAREALAGEGDILAIALDVGFGSKASFNRAFRDYAGCTPSQYRATLAAARRKS